MGGHVRRCCLLHLLPALCHSQSGAAERQAVGQSACRGHSGAGLRQPHGFVLHRLPAGPTGLLLL